MVCKWTPYRTPTIFWGPLLLSFPDHFFLSIQERKEVLVGNCQASSKMHTYISMVLKNILHSAGKIYHTFFLEIKFQKLCQEKRALAVCAIIIPLFKFFRVWRDPKNRLSRIHFRFWAKPKNVLEWNARRVRGPFQRWLIVVGEGTDVAEHMQLFNDDIKRNPRGKMASRNLIELDSISMLSFVKPSRRIWLD